MISNFKLIYICIYRTSLLLLLQCKSRGITYRIRLIYRYRALVLFNAAAAALAAAPPAANPVLLVTGQVIAPLCYNELSQFVVSHDPLRERGNVLPREAIDIYCRVVETLFSSLLSFE